MEGRTSQSTTNDKTEELNDTSKDDPLMHCLSDPTPEVLISAGNNASMINCHKSTLSQLNIASHGSLNVSNDNSTVFDSLTAPKKSSSNRKRKNSDSKENKKKDKKAKIVKKKKKKNNDDESIDNEERFTEIAGISKERERMKKGSDFSSDPITKRLTDIKNIMNKSFADIKKTLAQIESKYSSELKELRGLVQILIDNWNEFKSMPSTSSSRVLEEKTGFPESGFVRRSDNSIHLGEGIYISKKMYDSIASDATSNAVFVKKITMT
ncbi:uncharacterized protein LOC123266839 [Cotesia glomerata]|uniref:uncharacterized protein LOC123266839 n=1 Tax=Cotesia glomerata TaxID=32391 RepID=UPI001D00DE5D|nr:uncharacterized protein LOC123266839 [Cotesia glomerata]